MRSKKGSRSGGDDVGSEYSGSRPAAALNDVNRRSHWDEVYALRPAARLGWYRRHLEISRDWIAALRLPLDAPIIDAGSGVASLVDDLLAAGHCDLTLVDIAAEALAATRRRLGASASRVRWLCGDITALALPRAHFALWHDRAVFHFLVEPGERDRYLSRLGHALAPGGTLIIGAFAPEAPPRCSGLPVQRYTADQLAATLGRRFRLQHRQRALHVTPGGVEQMYVYAQFQYLGADIS